MNSLRSTRRRSGSLRARSFRGLVAPCSRHGTRGQRLRRWLAEGACALLLAAPAEAYDLRAEDLKPLGQFVSLETHRLHYFCHGSGEPVVVIDAGLGGSSIEWRAVVDALARKGRACAYDRAGYGWSDPGPVPRTTSRIADEFERLLDAIEPRGQVILVGHSFGGLNMRYFAATHPARVAGLILIEASDPAMQPVSGSAGHAAGSNPVSGERIALAAAGTQSDFAVASYLNSRRKAIFAQMDELSNFRRSAQEVESAGRLPPVPLVVIVRDPRHGDADRARERQWQEAHRAQAGLSPRGRLITATGSGHEVHRDRPDVVIRAIQSVRDAKRADAQ